MGRGPDVSFPLPDYLPEVPQEETVHEPARETPVIARCDVAVLGGGPAGVCAAAAAARCGARTLLVERHGCLGGMATVGLVNLWHSFYGMDRETKVIGGLPEELVRRLQDMGAVYNSEGDSDVGHWVLCSEHARFAFDDLALGSGVRLLLHATLSGAVCEGRRVTAALVETKSGRGAVLARVFIDCTGDADLVRRCGAPTELGDGAGACQAPTLCYRLDDVGPGGTGALAADVGGRIMDYNGEVFPAFVWGCRWPGREKEHMVAGTRVLNVNCADARDLTRAEVEARYQLRWVLDHCRRMPGWETTRLVAMAAQVGLRESHRILADHQLTRREVLHGVPFPDAIAQGTYPVDIHTPGAPGIIFEHLDGTFRRINPDRTTETGRWDGEPDGAPLRETLCYQVPYRCLAPRDLSNVLAAGRCSGASHEAAGAIRVMVNCMQLGQAAGVAAALCEGGEVRQVDVAAVQERLREMGMPLRT